MKTIILIIAIMMLVGCSHQFNEQGERVFATRIARFDGCQYVYTQHYEAWAHKGNCDNPIHEYNK